MIVCDCFEMAIDAELTMRNLRIKQGLIDKLLRDGKGGPHTAVLIREYTQLVEALPIATADEVMDGY